MNLEDKADRIVEPKMRKLMRALALEMTKRVVEKTPVDKGIAKNNWNVSVRAPDTSVTEEADPTGSKAIARAIPTIDGWEPLTDDAWLANGLPYIRPLEEGSSDQARNPDGMVRVSIGELKPWFKRQARKVSRE